MRTKLLTLATLGALIASPLLALPTEAAPAPTARVVGGNAPIRTAPYLSAPMIGRLQDQQRVTLTYCQPRSVGGWCRIEGGGWVSAGLLVGSAAKIAVTPMHFLAGPRFGLGFHRHRDDDNSSDSYWH